MNLNVLPTTTLDVFFNIVNMTIQCIGKYGIVCHGICRDYPDRAISVNFSIEL
jgi:hypothetical protein